MESPFLSVDCLNFTLSALECSSHDLNGVSLAYGNCTNVILGSQLLGEVGAHELSSEVGWGGEVGFS